MRRPTICAVLIASLLGGATANGGLFQDIYRGLEIMATPSGGPLASSFDGTRVNGQRLGRLRIVPDDVGRGHRLEFDRTFGTDSRGRPEIIDLGMYELQLAGAVQSTLSYTNRGWLIGNGTFLANNLNYSLRTKSGLQDVELFGRLNSSTSLEIDEFGFYRLNMDIGNSNSQLRVDGVLIEGSDSTNWDIGPINIKGNIYFDLIVALLGTLGADTTALEQLFPYSPIDRIVDEIQSQLFPPSLIADLSVLAAGETAPLSGLETATVPDLGLAARDPATASLVPEPGTLLLFCLGAVFLRARQR